MADDTIPQLRPIVTRAEAKAAGLKRYFTGKPCKRGHVAERIFHTGFCIECRREWDRANFEANPEKFQAKAKKRYAANPEAMKAKSIAWARLHPEANKRYIATNKVRLNEKRRQRHAANPKRKRLEKRLHRLANLDQYRKRDRRVSERFRDKKLQWSLQWQRDNPEKVRARGALRRARKNAAPGRHSNADIIEILHQQGGVCFYCFEPVPDDYHVDHFQPLTRGGSNWPDNLRIACPNCNARKCNRDPLEFMTNDRICLNAAAFPRFKFRIK